MYPVEFQIVNVSWRYSLSTNFRECALWEGTTPHLSSVVSKLGLLETLDASSQTQSSASSRTPRSILPVLGSAAWKWTGQCCFTFRLTLEADNDFCWSVHEYFGHYYFQWFIPTLLSWMHTVILAQIFQRGKKIHIFRGIETWWNIHDVYILTKHWKAFNNIFSEKDKKKLLHSKICTFQLLIWDCNEPFASYWSWNMP